MYMHLWIEPGVFKLFEQLGDNKQQTHPTHGTGPESNTGHIAGRQALSPLGHTCFPCKEMNNLQRKAGCAKKTTSCSYCPGVISKMISHQIILFV